jgi:hypothetical protein
MGDPLGPASSSGKASSDRARERAQSMFRSMLLAFAVGFFVLAIVAFIATKEVGVVFLLAFIFLGIVVCGWLGQRWLLRNISGDR